ncbi:MAG TPA: DUF262 domain-containing protein [Verrucomicrobiae bacterium]|jgi:uncharacterized protein with ParB-like and HNH nuclease domain|nr:DUF262 domain-containing protein [Verrucomicrobiae bacterium]
MKAEEKNIGQVLTEQFRYEIPAYQRPYSWESEHVLDLLQDVEESYDKQDKEYFIGSLISIERRTNEIYEGRVLDTEVHTGAASAMAK